MGFETVRFYQFRNLEDREISLENSREIFLVGENGQGKTNFLEGVYLLSYGSSFRTKNEKKLCRQGCQEMSAYGSFTDETGANAVSLKINSEKKEIRINGDLVRDRKELVRNIPCIAFTHEDYLYVKGGPEYQRFFFDQTLSLLNVLYIDTHRNYKRVLRTRNALLNTPVDSLSWEVWEEQLVLLGLEITRERKKTVEEFNENFSSLFSKISDLEGVCSIRYFPSWKEEDSSKIRQILEERRSSDQALGYTNSGPHRDRFGFFLDGRNFSETASTGQVRLISLILRVAQAQMALKKTGKKPILLLDDVLLELDGQRRRRFMKELPEAEQSFFTFLPEEKTEQYAFEKPLQFSVKGGHFERIGWPTV